MSDLHLIIPGRVVSENRALRFSVVHGHVHTYRTRECTAYQEQVQWFGRRAMGRREPLDGYLAVSLTLIAPNRSGLPDADGIAKAPLDALQRILWANDRQIDDLRIRRLIVPGQEHRLEVAVRRLQPGELRMPGQEGDI